MLLIGMFHSWIFSITPKEISRFHLLTLNINGWSCSSKITISDILKLSSLTRGSQKRILPNIIRKKEKERTFWTIMTTSLQLDESIQLFSDFKNGKQEIFGNTQGNISFPKLGTCFISMLINLKTTGRAVGPIETWY